MDEGLTVQYLSELLKKLTDRSMVTGQENVRGLGNFDPYTSGAKPVPMPDIRRPEGWVPGTPPVEMPSMPKITFPHRWMGRWYNEQEWAALQKRMRDHRQRQNESYRKSGRIPSWMSLLSNRL